MKTRTRSAFAVAPVIAAIAVITSQCDQSTDLLTDAESGVCGPVDVTTYIEASTYYSANVMKPPRAPHQSACNAQLTSDYADCQAKHDISKCDEFTKGQSGAACAACIESQNSDAQWGVIVFDGSLATFNIEGCVDNALGQVAMEPNSCGQLLHYSYGCQAAACSACTTSIYTDASAPIVDASFDGDVDLDADASPYVDADAGSSFDMCDASAIQGGCASFVANVNSATGPCASLIADAAPADVNACFPDPTIMDPTAQEVDFLTRIVTYMCCPTGGCQ